MAVIIDISLSSWLQYYNFTFSVSVQVCNVNTNVSLALFANEFNLLSSFASFLTDAGDPDELRLLVTPIGGDAKLCRDQNEKYFVTGNAVMYLKLSP